MCVNKTVDNKPGSGKELTFPRFEDIPVSTKTYTANTNLNIDIEKLYHILPITPYIVTVKKRGRKKKGAEEDKNTDIEPGSIVTVKHEGNLRGVELKPKKSKTPKKKWFRNSITVVIIFDKPINFKVCRNGTFQMTGCKNHYHAEQCVYYIWKYMKDHADIYNFTRGEYLEALFIPSMRNIDFSVGFLVDREKLNSYICRQKQFHCLLETSFGYTGVNIKIPLNQDISKMKIQKGTYKDNVWELNDTFYSEYLDLLSPKDRNQKINGDRCNTFLVFHSGKCIHSGLTAEYMKDVYYFFCNIIREAYLDIEERLEEDGDETGLSLEEELALLELNI